MNILILPSWYVTPENPLSGIFFKEQSIALQNKLKQKNNNDKIFIAYVEEFNFLDLKTYFKRKKNMISVEDGITTIRTKFLRIPKMHTLNFYLGANAVKKAIKKISKKVNITFDLVHIHSALNAGIWYSLSKLNIPYVITEHSTNYCRNLISERKKKLLSMVFNNSKKVIVVGDGLLREISTYTKNTIELVYNIVNNEYIPSSHQRIKNKDIVFFTLGLDFEKKGFDILLYSFQNFIERGYKGRLIIAGLNESEKEKLLSLDIKTEVLSHVELKGKLDRASVFNNMCNCDCFVLVSRYETFGVVFAEAMYCGKPVIATRTGGPDSFVNERNGLLVNIENVEETTEALIYMASNVSKYDSEFIRHFAEKKFSPDVICEKLYDIYSSVLGK